VSSARKIVFELRPDEDGYPPASSEGIWALPLENGNFLIDSIPFYVLGISPDDEVAAETSGEELVFKNLIRPSGNSTFRLLLTEPDTSEVVRSQLRLLGCESEFNQFVGLVAVEIPASVDIHPFLDFIVEARDEGNLDFEEAALRHKV
jgi:hypothetical protein